MQTRAVARVVAIVVCAVIAAAGMYVTGRARSEPVFRTVEGRLRGVPWAPFQPQNKPVRRTRDAERSFSHPPAPPRSASDAASWSDSSALHIDRGTQSGSPEEFVEAIAAADSALELDAASPEAHFNRALAIEHLGLRDSAATAWRQYLTIDAASSWSQEAARHLQTLTTPIDDFKSVLARKRGALERGDAREAKSLVDFSPLDARLFVETDALAAWADAIAGDPARAAKELAAARCIASELSSRGDSTMADAIAAIDRGRDGPGLARAHATLARARKLINSAPTTAEPLLREASALFSAAGSSMSELAGYYAAIAAFDQGRRTEANQQLKAILSHVPERRTSMRGLVLWQIGLCEGAAANWGATLRSLHESAEIFERLGEKKNAAFVRQILSEVYDAIGDHETAWRYRATVIRDLGAPATSRTETAVAAIAYDAAQRKRWRVAVSVLNLEIEIARSVRRAPQEVLAYLRRAIAKSELHDAAGAARDLEAARRIAASINDPALRERAEADLAMAGWIDAGSPQEALRRLTNALSFHEHGGRDMYLPVLHLQRARAYRELGNIEEARAELDAGIACLERDRRTLPDAAARLGIFDTSSELFEEAIGDAIARNDITSALAYSEQAHARALLDLLGASRQRVDPASVPSSTAIVEFASTPERLIVFVLTRDGLHAAQTDQKPAEVAAAAMRMRDALAHGEAVDADREARILHRQLIAPIDDLIRHQSTVVVVPNYETGAVPFAALRDTDGTYLFERFAIAVAPSAAVYLAIRPWERGDTPDALVVSAALSGEDRTPLAASRREARAVARIYRNAIALDDEQATAAEITRRAESADIIHFAGHGSSKSDDGQGATLLATFDDALTASSIESMKLPRKPLVVLAACGTARGEMRWSEGTLSIARAFLAAGAPSVIATSWPIDDAQSAEFFPRLHAHLARGVSVAEALRQTQLEFIHKPGSSASMWAAVQAIGR